MDKNVKFQNQSDVSSEDKYKKCDSMTGREIICLVTSAHSTISRITFKLRSTILLHLLVSHLPINRDQNADWTFYQNLSTNSTQNKNFPLLKYINSVF